MIEKTSSFKNKCTKILIAIGEYRNIYKHRNKSVYCKEIEKSISITESSGREFGGWALSKKSVRSFCSHLFLETISPHIIELGGGQSSLFWSNFQKCSNLKFNVTTFEHNPFWGNELKKHIKGSSVKINVLGLKTIKDFEKDILFHSPTNASELWLTVGKEVNETEYENTRITNAFYALKQSDFTGLMPCDGLIVDGPHGSGRSIAFSLFYNFINPGTIVLIDDYNHYAFLEDLGKCFTFDILEEQNKPYKSYIIVKITHK